MQLGLWFVTGWGRGREKVMCVAYRVTFVTERRSGREILMCDAVSVMICYRVWEREGNGDV